MRRATFHAGKLVVGLQSNGQPVELHFFPHAGHGFALGNGESYDPRVAELGWLLTAGFLARKLDNA